MEDRFSIMRYMPYLQSGGTTAQGIEALNRRTNNVVPAFTPYSMAPSPGTSFEDLQLMNPEPIDPFLDYQSPGLLSNLSTSLQVAQTAPKLLNMKVGERTLGQRLGANLSGPSTQLGNPFTTNVSAGTFTPQTQLGPTASAGGVTTGQAASNYFSNLKAGSVSAGVPTYIAGRLIRSAFDDDDPTTFTGGEMAGAAISGAGAASSLMALSPKLAALGPAGIALGIGISLFGGARKRRKARRLQEAYKTALKEREAEIREMYQESITEARKDREGKAQAANYLRIASNFNNPYGMGNMEKGGKMPKFFLGGAFNALTNIFTGAVDATTGLIEGASNILTGSLGTIADIGQTVTAPAFDAFEAVGENIIEPVTENVLQPALDTGFQAVEAGGEVLQMGIESGIDLAMDTIDFTGGMVREGMEGLSKIANPLIESTLGQAAPFVQSIGETITDPFMPDRQDVSIEPLPLPNIEEVSTIQDPNIVTVDPYTNKPIEKALDFSMASGSAGFVRPEDVEETNIYSETQESV